MHENSVVMSDEPGIVEPIPPRTAEPACEVVAHNGQRFVGGTGAEIIDAMLHALRLNGIDKFPGRGWQVSAGNETKTFKLLVEALAFRIHPRPEPVAWALCNANGEAWDFTANPDVAERWQRHHTDPVRPLVFGDVAHPSAAAGAEVVVMEALQIAADLLTHAATSEEGIDGADAAEGVRVCREAIAALATAPVVPVVTEAIAALAKLGLHELDQIMEPTLHPDLEDVVQSLGLATVDEHGEWTLTDKTEAGRAALTAELPEQPVPPVVSEAAASMLAERERQRSAEGWSEAHDDQHTAGVLGDAAACYAFAPDTRQRLNDAAVLQYIWPFGRQWWKPSPDDRRRELVKAGALILAEIERLDRTAALRPVEVERG